MCLVCVIWTVWIKLTHTRLSKLSGCLIINRRRPKSGNRAMALQENEEPGMGGWGGEGRGGATVILGFILPNPLTWLYIWKIWN